MTHTCLRHSPGDHHCYDSHRCRCDACREGQRLYRRSLCDPDRADTFARWKATPQRPPKPLSSITLGAWTVIPTLRGHAWQCNRCEKGYGSARTKPEAITAAIKHQRSRHA